MLILLEIYFNIHPLPINGIFEAIIVINGTLASNGKLAMCKTEEATYCTSMVSSVTPGHPPEACPF